MFFVSVIVTHPIRHYYRITNLIKFYIWELSVDNLHPVFTKKKKSLFKQLANVSWMIYLFDMQVHSSYRYKNLILKYLNYTVLSYTGTL
jgi:hypothetical protein